MGVKLRNVASIPCSTMIRIRNKFIFSDFFSPLLTNTNKTPANPTIATDISAIVGKISDGVMVFHFPI